MDNKRHRLVVGFLFSMMWLLLFFICYLTRGPFEPLHLVFVYATVGYVIWLFGASLATKLIVMLEGSKIPLYRFFWFWYIGVPVYILTGREPDI